MPYGWRARDTAPGVFRLGDQAAVIPSLAGEGMGIALASGLRAVAAYRAGQDAERFQQDFYRATARPVRVASLVRAAAETGWAAPRLVTAARAAPFLAEIIARLYADQSRPR